MAIKWFLPPYTTATQALRDRVKLHARKGYELALEAGLAPSQLSKIIKGTQKVRVGDPRVVKLGKLCGLKKSEVFRPVEEAVGTHKQERVAR